MIYFYHVACEKLLQEAEQNSSSVYPPWAVNEEPDDVLYIENTQNPLEPEVDF